MFILILSFLGYFLGYLIANFTKEELEPGKIYFKILKLTILLILSIILLVQEFSIIYFIIGFVIALVLRFEYLYFGLLVVNSYSNNFLFLNSALVFVYGFPYGSLIYFQRRWKFLVYNLVFLIIALVFYFIKFDFLPFLGGALLALFLYNLYKF